MTSYFRSPTLRALRVLCGLGLHTAALAAAANGGAPVTLNFANADIEGVARTLSDITHRNIVMDPRVKGTISLNTDTPVKPAQAWEQFLAALRLQGYVAVEAGGLYKIVPEAEGKLQSGSLVVGASRPGGDQIATEIFRLDYENAANLLPVLRPLISANNIITLNAGNNSLVVTDYANNLLRLRTIVAALDTPSATDVEVMPLRYGSAAEVAATVQRLSASTAASAGAAPAPAAPGVAATPAATGVTVGTGASIVADSQTNSLLVKAPSRAQLASIRALVARLDRPRENSNVRVVYLKNAEATRLAQILRAAFAPETTAAGATAAPAAATSSGASAASGLPAAASTSGTARESAQTTNPVSAAAQPTTGGGIQADPASNALIISAPEPKFREMRQIIDQLDTRRAQLYVESLVVEVDASKTVDLGVQWSQLFDISKSTTLTLGTVAKALEAMSGTNILSTANVVTLDNEEARIVVGQNVPFITGSYTSSTNSNPFQTVERKDVGITLRIRPQIGENGNIRMTIYQESSSVASTSSTLGPTTDKRAIESTVMVNDGRIIVLGGLIEEKYTDDVYRIPVLADAPMVGAFFRSLSRLHKKTNLIVFLRPVAMPDENASNALSLDRYDYISAKQHAMPADIGRLPGAFDVPPVLAGPPR